MTTQEKKNKIKSLSEDMLKESFDDMIKKVEKSSKFRCNRCRFVG